MSGRTSASNPYWNWNHWRTPHPIINEQWGKIAPEANAAYIITNFNEENVDDAIDLTKRAGLKYLYHYGKTFENWGHFELYKGEFPSGRKGLKDCVEKAKSQGGWLEPTFFQTSLPPTIPRSILFPTNN